MNTREKLESNELIGELLHRVDVLLTMEARRLTSRTRAHVERILDEEREKLRRHVEHTLK